MSDPLLIRRAALPLLLGIGATCLAGGAWSQDTSAPQAAATATATAATASAPAAAADPPKDSGPSAATLKLARESGMHTESKNGVTWFCWEDSNIGTRFKTKKCVDQTRLAEMLEQRQLLREQMHRVGCGGVECGGAK